MIPSNVVSFMKKMVASPESGQEQTQTTSAKLFRFKQTLTSGLQQAQDSVARFSAKRNTLAELHLATPQQQQQEQTTQENLKEPSNDTLDIEASRSRRGSMVPPDRSVTCRVCVRNLSAGDVAHRVCSQCQLKVCEDCASYSVVDTDIDQAFWRCSICRRRNQSVSRPVDVVPTQSPHRSTENLAHSLPEPVRSSAVPAASERRRERCPRSCGSDETDDADVRRNAASVRSVEDLRRDALSRYPASSTSPSESSLEEADTVHRSHKPAFLSVGEADRESSDSSDLSCLSPVPPTRDEVSTAAVALLSTTARKRPSLQVKRNHQHFYDADVSDGYDADEQSGTLDSTPSPASSEFVVPLETLISARRVRDRSVSEGSRTPRAEDQEPKHRKPSAQFVEVAPRIIIDDVDNDRRAAIRVARLLRDPVPRPRPKTSAPGSLAFGLTVVGGKRDPNGRLYAVVAHTEPGGPAERAGIQAGDYVISWDGVRLTDLSFEEVQRQLEHSGDCIEVQFTRGNGSQERAGPTPPSPVRRRLPQAPVVPKASQDVVFCRLQLKLKLTGQKLSIGVICAEEVYLYEDESLADAAFVWIQVELLLPGGEISSFSTEQVEGSVSPRWNSLFVYQDADNEEILHSSLCCSLWEETYRGGKICLAETKFDLGRVSLDGRSVWYPLKECGNVRRASVSFGSRKRSSKTGHQDFHGSTDDIYDEDDDDSSSAGFGIPRSRSAESNLMLLHPDAAVAGVSAPASLANSRRGSANLPDIQHPRSLPPSRRGSSVNMDARDIHAWDLLRTADLEKIFQNAQLPRRSQSFRASGENCSGENRKRQMSGSSRSRSSRMLNASSLGLGPGQVDPLEAEFPFIGQLKLAVVMARGRLEVEVIAARNLPDDSNGSPPDTFVKVYLSDQGRLKNKRETRIMRQTNNPQFHQTLIYEANELEAECLVAVVCHNKPMLPSGKRSTPSSGSINQSIPLGIVEILLERLPITTLTMAWYRLIPMNLASADVDGMAEEAY